MKNQNLFIMLKFKNIFILFIALLFFNNIIARNLFSDTVFINNSQDLQTQFSRNNKNDIVYVCFGDYAKKYHSRSNCTGLNNCQGDLYSMDSYTAINKYSRTACCVCYNCGGTGGGGGSGGASDNENKALGYVAIAVVVTSAAILSNDFYFYPSISFKSPNYKYINKRSSSIGWAMGFRKTFKNCALEYGVTKFKAYQNNSWNYYQYSENENVLGVHLNFIHHIFLDKTPEWLRVYFGPTVNFINDIGYGGIIGSEIKLIGRLKFNARYEISSQTNQFQAGLVFKYQKKYLWQ